MSSADTNVEVSAAEIIGVGGAKMEDEEFVYSAANDNQGQGDYGDENGATKTVGDEDEDMDEDERGVISMTSNMCSDWKWFHVMYLSLFTTVGVTIRAFAARFFGEDCSSASEGQPIDDWLWPVSHKICVTTSGTTEQYGGALFLDLPANMIGSFVMGFMTGHSADWPVLPCLRHDHPLQSDSGLHVGIRTALCGSLTTFSSWNSQMVLMMDGTANPYLGSQILAAILGYVLGLQAAVASFRAGRTVAAWIHLRRNPHVFDSDLSKKGIHQRWYHDHLYWITPVLVFILFGTLIALYIMGDVYWGIAYYRQLWIACIVAPIGTIVRWKLSALNGKYPFPAGTFLANFIGSILSAALNAWSIIESSDKGAERWEIPTIKAVSLGIAGSLSTVSTFVKECTEMVEKNPHFDKKSFLYSHGSMLICCFFGLMVYSPIVRYAN
mmetsp:Transcript_8550/g.18493  ORF Transcript_8550/g.18493 Transcript_8550/m.18493 type:complete len:439 (-) Transcript_8550:1519-2835(-)